MQDPKVALLLVVFACVACGPDGQEPTGDPTLSTDPSDPPATFDTNDSDDTTGPKEPTTGGTSGHDDTTGTTAAGTTSTTDLDTTTATTTEPTTGGSEMVTIYDIQEGKISDQTQVLLTGVVVTSPVFFGKNGDGNFFVAEQPGGEFSGIQVYVYADVAAELDSEGKLPNVGDVLDLEGLYQEFFGNSELYLEVAVDLTITGSAVPVAAVVVAADVATQGAKAENYEGCLVQIDGATVTAPVVDFGQFTVDDALIVDDLFFVPTPGPKPPMGTQFTALVGLMAYNFEEFKLNPRSCADLQGWGDCP